MTTMGAIIEAVYDLSLGLTLICAIVVMAVLTVVAFWVVKR
jgi:hypothetical protein